jgi:hypothetical protein
VLNGQKMWITNGGFADLFTIFAKVDGEHFTAFLVERSMGVVSGREEPKLGLDGSSTTAIVLENVRVPTANVLGTIGEGHKVAFNVLNIGRLKLGTRNIGCARNALERAIEYARQRHQFGRAIGSFGLIRQKLAEMAVRCWVGDAMVYRTLGDADRALDAVAPDDSAAVLKVIESCAVECSINKVWTSETLAYVVDEAVQVYGGYGYSKEYPAERAFRDARITRLYEGTNEINRLIVPTRLAKKLGSYAPVTPSGPLASEREIVSIGKRLVRALLELAPSSEEQEILGCIADIAIEVYAIESAILRAEKRPRELTFDAVRIYASDANDRIVHAARTVIAAIPNAPRSELAALAAREPYDTIAARRRIADAMYRI